MTNHNPPGVNPLKRIRLAANLTQKALAQSTDPPVTPQVVLRAEQGLFSAPPPSLLFALSQVNSEGFLSPSELAKKYYTWVYLLRSYNSQSSTVKNALTYFQHWAHSDNDNDQRIAWVDFRRNILGLSVASTAKLLVVQISLLQDLERTGRNAAMVQDLLLTWGIPGEAINFQPYNIIKHNQEVMQ